VVLFLSNWVYYFFWACNRLGVYAVTIAGWSSNSGYSLLGVLRALAQTISHEVRLAFILLSFVVLICRYNLAYFYSFQLHMTYKDGTECFETWAHKIQTPRESPKRKNSQHGENFKLRFIHYWWWAKIMRV